MIMTIKTKCAKCGKEVTLDDKWKSFAEKFPERVTCMDCKDGAKKSVATAYKNTEKPANPYKKSTTQSNGDVKKVSAEMFRKAYDEITAEFSDVLDDVKDYIGGWTSTMVINRLKEKD